MRISVSPTGVEHMLDEQGAVTCGAQYVERAVREGPVNRSYACARCMRLNHYLAQLPERTERERALGRLALDMAERGRDWYRS